MPSGGRGYKSLFLIISVLGHAKGVGGISSVREVWMFSGMTQSEIYENGIERSTYSG